MATAKTKTPSFKPATSVTKVIETILRFNSEKERYTETVPHARAWYAFKDPVKGYLFGPSKVIGYEDINADMYLGNENDLDGRVTEAVLKRWSTPVGKGHPLYQTLHVALNEFCGELGKKPNSLARFSLLTNDEDQDMPADEIVSLLAAVFNKLNPAQKAAFQKLTA